MGFLASTYDQSRFLRAGDIAGSKKARIKNATEEPVGEDRTMKPVVWFTNLPKGLVLNKTNNRVLRGAFGDYTDGWIGKVIELFTTMADFRGQMKPALRVRIPPPAAPVVTPQPQPAAPQATTAPSVQTAPVVDQELEPDQVKPLDEEMGDNIPF